MEYLRSRWLFLRLLGAVYFVAFVSLVPQLPGLVGAHGIMPAARYLEWARSLYGGSAYLMLPTVFWLGAGDAALRLVVAAGVLLSLALVAGLAPRMMLVLLWVLYLSVVVAGQDFLSFQWDALLLETGLLALLWAPGGFLPRRAEGAPSELARWLLVFLLFKLMFLSGVTKLLSGDPTWRHATALDYHFETQPLPPWTAWFAHHLPSGVHRVATAAMFGVELIAPWLVLAPPPRFTRVRAAGCAAIVLLQLGIIGTGNYGFFNLLTVALCVPVLDDRFFARLAPRRLARKEPESGLHRRIVSVAGTALLVLSTLAFLREIAYTIPGGRAAALAPRWSEAALAVVAPFRSINGYGLFRVMTTERPELVLEGSDDGTHWLEYEFPYKPGVVTRRPRFVAPYHPRLDWQMWFAALDPPASAEWLSALGDRIRAGTPEVLALLASNPFPQRPPRYLRLVQYRYESSSAEERRRSGAWWVRERIADAPLGPAPGDTAVPSGSAHTE